MLLRSDLTSIAQKLYSKSIISVAALAEAMNHSHSPIDRTVSLLSVVEDKIRTEPRAFKDFVEILQSDGRTRGEAERLVIKYNGMRCDYSTCRGFVGWSCACHMGGGGGLCSYQKLSAPNNHRPVKSPSFRWSLSIFWLYLPLSLF